MLGPELSTVLGSWHGWEEAVASSALQLWEELSVALSSAPMPVCWEPGQDRQLQGDMNKEKHKRLLPDLLGGPRVSTWSLP